MPLDHRQLVELTSRIAWEGHRGRSDRTFSNRSPEAFGRGMLPLSGLALILLEGEENWVALVIAQSLAAQNRLRVARPDQ